MPCARVSRKKQDKRAASAPRVTGNCPIILKRAQPVSKKKDIFSFLSLETKLPYIRRRQKNQEANMKNRFYISSIMSVMIVVSAMLFVFAGSARVYAGEVAIYGHISYVDGEAFVLKPDGEGALKAVVNLPLVPGDVIYTEDRGRCELQFDNGTLIRLDENTEIKLNTVLSKSLTSKDKITTLQLHKGAIFNMNQVYNDEIFQVITPTAAIKMYERSTNLIEVNKDGETEVSVVRGKMGILYGAADKTSKKRFLGAGKSALVTRDHELQAAAVKKDVAFVAWNEYLNRNFKELHYGISQVPEVIYRRSPGIVHFAEKWSTKFGVWEYNELFGYVWKPFEDVFHGNRPFWDANYVRVNGEMVLVPNQPWAWAPAHLGTWFFSKTYGWVWIPGDAFSQGICAVGLWPAGRISGPADWLFYSPHSYAFSTLGHWIDYIFGGGDLYYIYRTQGGSPWRTAYVKKFASEPVTKKPSFDGVPENIKAIIAKIDKVSIEKIAKHLISDRPGTGFKLDVEKIIKEKKFAKNRSAFCSAEKQDIKGAEAVRATGLISHNGGDWNPDAKWAGKVGVKILYSSKDNAVICPKLGISSGNIDDLQRNLLRRAVVDRSLLLYSSGASKGGPGAPTGMIINNTAAAKNNAAAAAKTTGTAGGSSGSNAEKK